MKGQNTGSREKIWAFFHPITAMKMKKISKRCYTVYNNDSLKARLDKFENGGKLDAFRHVFFMASFAQKVGAKKLDRLGELHEKHNYKQFLKGDLEQGELPDSLSSVMDLYNNTIGIEIGRNNKKCSLNELKLICINAINNGKTVFMRRDKNGNYLDCNGRKVELIKKWSLDKCLVSQD